jgi:ionotropic glutamate receptor
MLIGFWWLFVIVTVTTYSGNLVAFLTFPKIESPVNTVDDLTSYRGVNSWGFLEGSVIEDHLKV